MSDLVNDSVGPLAPAATSRRNKFVLIGIWGIGALLWLGPSLLMNLYTFGGIDFPDDPAPVISSIWPWAGPILVYGSLVIAPVLAIVGVLRRDLRLATIVAILAVPIVLQVGALAGYLVMSETYGNVCC